MLLSVTVFTETANGIEVHPLSGSYNRTAFTEKLAAMTMVPNFKRIEVTESS